MKLSDIEFKLNFNDDGKAIVTFTIGFEDSKEMEEMLGLMKQMVEEKMEKNKINEG